MTEASILVVFLAAIVLMLASFLAGFKAGEKRRDQMYRDRVFRLSKLHDKKDRS